MRRASDLGRTCPRAGSARIGGWSAERSTCPPGRSTTGRAGRPTGGPWCSCTGSSSTTRCGRTCPSGWPSGTPHLCADLAARVAHRRAMKAGADLSPRGAGRGSVLDFLRGPGAAPTWSWSAVPAGPAPRPGARGAAVDAAGRLRNSKLGFGWLVRRDLAPEESKQWVTPYLTDAGVRRDVATFCRGWRPDDLLRCLGADDGVRPAGAALLGAGRPVLQARARTRLLATFPDATLVEFRGARTFVSLDQPERLAERWCAGCNSLAAVTLEPTRARFPDFAPRRGGYESFYLKAAAASGRPGPPRWPSRPRAASSPCPVPASP